MYCEHRKGTIGYNVIVHIPRIDRTSTDQQPLPCIVVKVTGKAQELYKLHCKGGVIKTSFLASDLECCEGSFGLRMGKRTSNVSSRSC